MIDIVGIITNTQTLSLATQVLILIYLAYETRRGKIKNLENLVTSLIAVVRALARTDNQIDEDKVDRHLLEEGINPEHFTSEMDDKDKRLSIEDNDT